MRFGSSVCAIALMAMAATGVAEEVAAKISDFEQPGSASEWGWYWGGGGTVTISESQEQAKGGKSSAKVEYSFAAPDGNFTLRCINQIPPNPTFLRMWVYGDGSGHSVSLRIIDRTGQTFLYRIVRSINWTGWRQITAAVGSYSQTWSGNSDEIIDLPATIAFQMNGKKAGAGTIYIDDIEVGSWLDDNTRIEMKSGAPLFGNIWFGKQEAVEVPFAVSDRGGAAADLKFKYLVTDSEGREMAKGEKPVKLEKGAAGPAVVSAPVAAGGKFGYFGVAVEICQAASGKVLQKIETSAAIVPQPAILPAEKNPFGMNLSVATRHTPSLRAQGAAMARKSGVGWTREEFSWDKVESEKGKFNWGDYDHAIAIARKEGLGVLGLIGFSAKWARRDADKFASPPVNVQDYADFVYKVVDRYKGQIKHWEIWNEPDSPTFWPPKSNAAEYTEMLKAAYAAAKRADPDCKVLTAGLLVGMNHFKQWQYLDEMYNNGAASVFDIMGWHAYCDPKSPIVGLYPELTQELFNQMQKHGDGNKVAWLTEQGWPTIKGYGRSVSEPQQALYAVQSHVLALSNKSVEKFFWFLFRDGGNRESDHEQSYGILHPDGAPKPAYPMYAAMTALLMGKAPAEPLALPGKLVGRVFMDGKVAVMVVWDESKEGTSIPLTDMKRVAVYDMYGNAVKSADSLELVPERLYYIVCGAADLPSVRAALAPAQ